jgi:cell division inhibitor SepF
MGIFDKMSQIFGTSIEEEEKETETNEPEPEKTPKVEPKEPPATNNVLNFSSVASNIENDLPQTNKFVKSKITTIKPKSFEDAQTVANFLRDKIPVIVNFEETDINDAKRIIDFISGTTYAVDGKIRQVSSKVFICAPENITVSSSEDDKKSNLKFLD